jgi:hypothetical protein
MGMTSFSAGRDQKEESPHQTTPPASHVVNSWVWPHIGIGEASQNLMTIQMNSASFLLVLIGANLVFSWRVAQPFVHWQPTLVKSQNPIR